MCGIRPFLRTAIEPTVRHVFRLRVCACTCARVCVCVHVCGLLGACKRGRLEVRVCTIHAGIVVVDTALTTRCLPVHVHVVRKIHLDIWMYRRYETYVWEDQNEVSVRKLPISVLFPLRSCSFEGFDVPCPRLAEGW